MEGRFATQCHFIGNKLGGYDRNAWVGITEICNSFACIALANKVSMETIAKMLGHSDIRTTKIYAKVLDTTISKEMVSMKNKFSV